MDSLTDDVLKAFGIELLKSLGVVIALMMFASGAISFWEHVKDEYSSAIGWGGLIACTILMVPFIYIIRMWVM